MTLDGTPLSPALGIGAFAEQTLVAAGQCVKVDPRARPEAAGLIGCGVMAGFGAAVNTGGVGRGDTVAVIGCGGVGDAAIAASALAGARTVIAVDVDARKLEWAKGFGATHTVNSTETDPVEAIKELTDGNGADVVIEAVGRPETYRQAFFARDLAGTLVQVGVPNPTMTIELPADRAVRPGRGPQVVVVRRLPADPRLPHAHRPVPAGKLDLDGFVSRDDRHRRGGGGLPQDGARRGAPLGGGALMSGGHGSASTGSGPTGIFSLDGQSFDVENNIWLVGDDDEVLVIDAAHEAGPIVEARRRPPGGGHRLHPRAQRPHQRRPRRPRLRRTGARSPCTTTTACSGSQVYAARGPDMPLKDGQTLRGRPAPRSQVLHTPGHSPGGVCLHLGVRRRPLLGRHAVQGRARAPPAGRSRTSRPSSSRSATSS